eukprot:7192252-Ditylum_brightwellii.AAC.1
MSRQLQKCTILLTNRNRLNPPCNHSQKHFYHHTPSSSSSSSSSTTRPPLLSLTRATSLLSSQSLTSIDLSTYCHTLATIGEQSYNLNAFSQILPFEAIQTQARESDERRAQGKAKSILDGIPISIKANIAVEGVVDEFHACSNILKSSDGNAKNGYNADVIQRLVQDCGVVVVGITNMDEFGMGSLGTNVAVSSKGGMEKKSSFVRNPLPYLRLDGETTSALIHANEEEIDEAWLAHIQSTISNPPATTPSNSHQNIPILSCGGSSSGSAASVSHGSSLFSIGTDTGGSIRLPASYTSIVGFKPTYGSISRYGVISYASSLDTV